MATAKKLPSGSWRVRVVDHYETGPDGKRKTVFQSFTSNDTSKNGKKEAERMAAEWEYSRKKRPESISVHDCIEKYIEAKSGVLSPATVGGYLTCLKNHYSSEFGNERLRDLTDEKVQLFISSLSASGFTGKSVHNIYSLFSSAASMFKCHFDVTLPKKKAPDTYTPIEEEVNRFLDYLEEGGEAMEDLYDCVMLAAFGPLRRGEIACLLSSDVTDNGVLVTKDMVMDRDKMYIVKEYPKMEGTEHEANLPPFLIERLKKRIEKRGEGRLFDLNPHCITMRFNRAIKKVNVPHFRLHDLRHYWVSIAHALGMPEQYILDNGGWKTAHVMKRVYRDSLRDVKKKEAEKLNSHFSEMMNKKNKSS